MLTVAVAWFFDDNAIRYIFRFCGWRHATV